MVITVFGDIHGNLVALERLYQLEKETTDLFICHGDVVNYGPWSNECVLFLEDIKNCEVLKGNHEDYFLKGFYNGSNIIAKTFFETCYPKFDTKNVNILKEYKEIYSFEDYVIRHTLQDMYIFADTNLDNMALNANYVIGHSHQQFYRKVDGKFLYNTGSIGQNRQYLNQSCYIQIDTKSNVVHLKSFLHDINKVINEMKKENYPDMCVDYYLSKQKVIPNL